MAESKTKPIYIRRLSDVDLKTIEKLVTGWVTEVRRRHG